jgi:hypothetical protein
MLCHCGGDIDDCEFDGTPEQDRCGHCDGEEDREYDDDPSEAEDNHNDQAPELSNSESDGKDPKCRSSTVERAAESDVPTAVRS